MVSHGFDIGAGYSRHQPVLREPGNAQYRAEQRSGNNTRDRYAQGIKDADPYGAAVGVGRRVLDSGLANGKAGLAPQKAEARGNIASCQVMQGVGNKIPNAKRSEERRGGKEGGSTGRSMWKETPKKK